MEEIKNASISIISNKLPNFNERILTTWENYGSAYDEVYRIIIPRCLYAMYCIRNKRGMIHKNHIDPNKMDATILLNDTKWVLAEFFRMSSTLSFGNVNKCAVEIYPKFLKLL